MNEIKRITIDNLKPRVDGPSDAGVTNYGILMDAAGGNAPRIMRRKPIAEKSIPSILL